MSETYFPINDLLRRKLQTSLVVVSLALCVASAVFLFLSGERIGFGITLMVEGKLTAALSTVFSQFMIFIGLLIFLVSAAIVSFMVSLMMSQRIKDIGLMKAVGCPNDLVFGYFMNELLIVTLAGCSSGVILGITADFASTTILGSLGVQIPQKTTDFWLVPIVFALFFALAMIFGAKPVLDTTKLEPGRAMSPTYYVGLSEEGKSKTTSRSGLTAKIALRSLFRRKGTTFRIVLCMTVVFVLITVAIAGGVIAGETTKNWIDKAVGKDVLLIAHPDVCRQYELLLSKFYETNEIPQLNFTNERYLASEDLRKGLSQIPEVTNIDARLILDTRLKEVRSYAIDPETLSTVPVGDSRESDSLVVGVEPRRVVSDWLLNGRFLNESQPWAAIVGDSLAQKMFSEPLEQSMIFLNRTFEVAGICVDPINNGHVTYVLLSTLQNITGAAGPNAILIQLNPSANRTVVLNQIKANIASKESQFEVLELNEMLSKSTSFLGYIWTIVMLIPAFSLAAACLCLMSYVMLTVMEQRHELGVLRALGARPLAIVKVVSLQSLVVLLSSYAVGISIGLIITLMILVSEPLVTSFTIMQISGWLLVILTLTFLSSLWPAVRLMNKPILENMA